MSQDDIDDIPSIIPERESGQDFTAGKPRGGKPDKPRRGAGPPKSGGNGGGGLWSRLFITLALVVAGVACAWAFQLQERLELADTQMDRYASRIADLEDRLSDTDEGLSQNTAAMAVKIKELYSEVDKLWASAWRRNKAAIEELQKTSASEARKVAAVEKSLAGTKTTLTAATNDIAKLKNVAADLERLMASAKSNQAQVEKVADNLNRINVDLAKLSKRVQDNEDWVNSINAFRGQVNRTLSDLQSSVNTLQEAP